MADNNRIFDTALQIRSARAVDDYLGSVRMALEESQENNLTAVRALRDEMVEGQQAFLESQNQLVDAVREFMGQMTDLVAALGDLTPVVNIPETKVTLQQQPVQVNVPKTTVNVKPTVVNIPEPKVTVEMPEKKLPDRLTIKHSDGTQSTIEFGR